MIEKKASPPHLFLVPQLVVLFALAMHSVCFFFCASTFYSEVFCDIFLLAALEGIFSNLFTKIDIPRVHEGFVVSLSFTTNLCAS